MPLDKNIKKAMVIGSGPIVIGQAAEFDYAGTQACRALREDGIEIVLVNSNPATIMTDRNIADKIYIEPLTLPIVKRIIEKEKPDSILSGLGGQTGLTLCMQLAKEGFLEKHNIRLLGSTPEAIDKAEDRGIFKDTMLKIGQPCIPSKIANDFDTAMKIADEIGYPIIIRPAFTLGGSGGGIAATPEDLAPIVKTGLSMSPISQILVEKSIAGWKEIEFEVMRDRIGNCIIVCSMENVDPVGVHTGDSIVVAPCVTLSSVEFGFMRQAALDIVEELGIWGGCNVQMALHPTSFEYAVIEVNPRVSRSSALASKATGYPIARVSTKVAIGYNLDEIKNMVTGTTFAANEPVIDYVAVKLPKWPFDKFVYAKKELGPQMKATGEVMAVADTFELALLKAVRGAELGLSDFSLPILADKQKPELLEMLKTSITDTRLFVVNEAFKKGATIEEIHDITKIDPWFLRRIKKVSDGELKFDKPLLYKTVDTCAGEYTSQTPYFYSVQHGTENEALPYIENSTKERIVVLGSGPIRIGQGIEFDYACVHCVWTLKKMGYEVVVINNNPETVSTDYDTADRLYFEALCIEDVMNVIDIEKPVGVIVAFGGGTAIKLTKKLAERGVKIIGTSSDSIDMCEDRQRFDNLLEKLDIKRPEGTGVFTLDEALKAANKLGYPVLMRPSYVLGGQNMIIAFDDGDVKEYMEIILRVKQENPILIDKYLSGLEIEVDAICDGKEIFIPGIMEHVERTGVHSGDSISLYPAMHVDDTTRNKIFEMTKKMCLALDVHGLANFQYVLYNGEIYVIEVNPRASRTVPYISKATGIPICEMATKAGMGLSLSEMGYSEGIGKIPPYSIVKAPVFSFEKLADLDTHLGPEMKSTGEVLGIGKSLGEALYKGFAAAKYKMVSDGEGKGVFITVRDSDKADIADVAGKFIKLGFEIFATEGTKAHLAKYGHPATLVDKIYDETDNNIVTLLESGKISYIISTSSKGRNPAADDVKTRIKATVLGIPCTTSIDTANALADSLLSGYNQDNVELIDINLLRSERSRLKFTKMQACGNDFIFFNCFENKIESPESLAVMLSNRNYGVGSDGIVLIQPPETKEADAKMIICNSDGSKANTCGNAIRCVAKYLYDSKIVTKKDMAVETAAGVKKLSVTTHEGKVISVTVDMGKVELDAPMIPVKFDTVVELPKKGPEIVADKPMKINNKQYMVTCYSLGNPHAVVFADDVDTLNIEEIGPKFENNTTHFPKRVNADFVKVIDRNNLRVRTWERGSGVTLSCGTSAGVAAAACLNNHCGKGEDIKILFDGGEITVNYTDESLKITGDCQWVFDGEVEV